LAKWGECELRSKAEAEAVLDEMRQAIRTDTFGRSRVDPSHAALTFKALATVYIDRYVKANALASGDTIEFRMAPLLQHFGDTGLVAPQGCDDEVGQDSMGATSPSATPSR
jgi:hypothetical protein